MKSIDTLVPDIYKLVEKRDGWLTETLGASFGLEVSARLREQYNPRIVNQVPCSSNGQPPLHVGQAGTNVPSLRMSRLGPRCPRALWYETHHPELAETIPPWVQIKFSYGHILECWAITLAKAAGHTVEGEQDAIYLDGITGHRDCVIDGCVVDVKSASSRSFLKFKDRSLRDNDPFGYLEQLDGYVVASAQDDIVKVKDRGYLLAIDKTLGHMVIYEHRIREEHVRRRIREFQQIVNRSSPPHCECQTTPDGKAGNLKLDTKASYSSFKHCCFPHLRTFLYASGPVYLTRVIRKPDVIEVDKLGKVVYN